MLKWNISPPTFSYTAAATLLSPPLLNFCHLMASSSLLCFLIIFFFFVCLFVFLKIFLLPTSLSLSLSAITHAAFPCCSTHTDIYAHLSFIKGIILWCDHISLLIPIIALFSRGPVNFLWVCMNVPGKAVGLVSYISVGDRCNFYYKLQSNATRVKVIFSLMTLRMAKKCILTCFKSFDQTFINQYK